MADSDQIQFDRVEKMECPSCHIEVDVGELEPFSTAACPGCGAELKVPAHLANYRLDDCLGSGGMGSVYRAYDETLARTVAVKVMRKALGEQPEFLASFRREAQAAAGLNHPNIAQIYSFGEENGQPYIVMEFVPGKHLDKMIESPEPLPQPLVMKIGMDIAAGLQLAAVSNLIHGDIKPENILLDDRGSAKLVDFGIASSPDDESTEIWGTPYYISPEKIKREKVDFHSDMYCLGGTLYHALSKHPPFDGDDAMAVVKARLTSAPRPLHDVRPDIDPDVEKIVMRMLELDPARRFPNYGELIDAIGQYLARAQPQQAAAAASSGGASKRIIIKGRGRGSATRTGMSAPEPAPAPSTAAGLEPAAPPPTGPHKGIRINKGRKGTLLQTPGEPPPQDADEDESAEPRKSPVGKIILFSILGLVLLIGAGVGGVFYFLSAKESKAQQEIASKIASQSHALVPLAQISGSTASLGKRIDALAQEADGIVEKAVAAVEKAVGVEYTSRILQEDVPVEEPFDDSIDSDLRGVGGEDAEDADGEEANGEAADGEGAAKEGEEAPADGEAAAAGDGGETPAEGGAEAAAEDGGEAAVASDETGEAASGDGAAAADGGDAEATAEGGGEAASEDGEELEGVALMARDIFLMLAPVRNAKRLSDRTVQSVSGLWQRATESTNVTETARDAIFSAVDKNIERVEKLAQKASLRYGNLEDAVGGLDKAVKEAKSKLNDLTAETARLAAENERKAAEEKAAEEARIERERKEAEEAARRAEEAAEVEKVRGVVPANFDNIRNHKFDAVLRELGKLDGSLKYPSAKRALKAEKRRVEGLKELKDFLIQRLNSGDKFAHPKQKWSVLSADERRVEIQPAKKGEKPVKRKWEELAPEQVVPMLLHYIHDPEKAKSLLLRERVNAYFNTAIYFVVMRGDDDNAKAAAKMLCERAMADSPSKRNEISETLYELDLTDAETQE